MKPIVFASKCFGFEACRYDGITIHDDFIEKLKPYVHYITACPEKDAGLGVPRDPIRIIEQRNVLRLVQPATKRDFTDKMQDTCKKILDSLQAIDGFILKSRSPSCGIKDVKIYPRMEKSAVLRKNKGLFAQAVIKRFGFLPIEDEGRLTNFRIREHFLTRLFTFARFRRISKERGIKALVKFHAEHKFLLMAYNQSEMKKLGRIVANHEKKPRQDVFHEYQFHLYKAFAKIPCYTSNINVLMHALGYFSKKISPAEKTYFLQTLDKYRSGKIPLSVNCAVLKSWIIKYDEKYLGDQIFFEPYPEALIEITDSGKGRNFRK